MGVPLGNIHLLRLNVMSYRFMVLTHLCEKFLDFQSWNRHFPVTSWLLRAHDNNTDQDCYCTSACVLGTFTCRTERELLNCYCRRIMSLDTRL